MPSKVDASRDVKALLPIEPAGFKTLDANFAIRNDRYSDFGSASIIPKVSLRWQPAKSV